MINVAISTILQRIIEMPETMSTIDQNKSDNMADVVSFKEWFITLCIFSIPVINVIMIFVWAFSKKSNPNKANFFKSFLILYTVFALLVLAFYTLYLYIVSSMS